MKPLHMLPRARTLQGKEARRKATHRMIPSLRNAQNWQIHREREQISDCQGVGRGKAGRNGLMGMGFPFGLMNVLWNWTHIGDVLNARELYTY